MGIYKSSPLWGGHNQLKSFIMEYLVHPSAIVDRALSIDGFKHMMSQEEVQFSELVDTSIEVAEEWTLSWGDYGFGSSDGTALLKDFIDTIIGNRSDKYKTAFNPYLSVVKS